MLSKVCPLQPHTNTFQIHQHQQKIAHQSLPGILPCLKCTESQGHKTDAHFKKQGCTKG